MATRVKVEIDEQALRRLVVRHLSEHTGLELADKDVRIEVKSRQNYRSEWEQASFRAVVDRDLEEK